MGTYGLIESMANSSLFLPLVLIGTAFFIWILLPKRQRKYTGWSSNPATNRNAWARSAPETDSPIEEKLLTAMRQTTGLPEPVLQFELKFEGSVFTVPDMAYPDNQIAVFCDSKAFHAEIGQLIDDARKRNILSMHGWIVLVYWGPDIHRDPLTCARNIREAYDLSRARLAS